jgi:hypothetical protein
MDPVLTGRTRTRRPRTVGALIALAFSAHWLLPVSVAFAEGTSGSACDVAGSHIPKVLGKGATAQHEEIPFPEFPEGDKDQNHFVDVFEDGCTWAVVGKASKSVGSVFVNVHLYERNQKYSGGTPDPWTPGYEANTILKLVGIGKPGTSGYVAFDPPELAKRAKISATSAEASVNATTKVIVGDRATRGRRAAIVGIATAGNQDFVAVAVSSTSAKVDALNVAWRIGAAIG